MLSGGGGGNISSDLPRLHPNSAALTSLASSLRAPAPLWVILLALLLFSIFIYLSGGSIPSPSTAFSLAPENWALNITEILRENSRLKSENSKLKLSSRNIEEIWNSPGRKHLLNLLIES